MDYTQNIDIRDINQNIAGIEKEFPQGDSWEMHGVLYYIAKNIKPEHYLEIGVFRGRSMALVLKASSQTKGYGIDLWGAYGKETTQPADIITILKDVNIENLPTFFSGCSQELLPDLWQSNAIPDLFNLILVDGDHTFTGARKDLELCIPHLKKGGILIFHDITHPDAVFLADLVLSFKRTMSDFLFIESYKDCGVCLMIKLPFPWKLLKGF